MRLPLFSSRRRRCLPASARIHATPDGVALTMPLPAARDSGDLLVCTGRLPGNARVARRGTATLLLAELAAGADAAACALAVTEALAMPRDDASGAVDTLDQAAIAVLLGKARLRPDAIVARDGGCEVRVPTGGVVRPVLVLADGDGLRLTHALLAAAPVVSGGVVSDCTVSDSTADAMADHALRCNARIRHARLAQHGAQVRAEVRLAGAELTPDSLARAVRAVAALATHAAFALHLLNEDAFVRAQYAHIVLGRGPRLNLESPHQEGRRESKEKP